MTDRQQKLDAYTALGLAVQTNSMMFGALKLKTKEEVRALLGVSAAGLSDTFIGNMQRKLVKQMQLDELQSAADWILSRILSTYPNADVSIKRDRIVQVWLDGKPEEIE